MPVDPRYAFPALISLFLVVAPGAIALAQPSGGPGYGVVVYPERPTTVELSNRDINRVVCSNGDFEDYKYSGEKGIIVEASGSNAFVKFQILETGADRQYVTARSEFFLKCAGEMFTIFGSPKNMASQTVFLGGELGAAQQKNEAIFNPLSDEERAVAITHHVLKETAPHSFSRTLLDEPFRDGMAPGADLRRRAHYHIEGSGFSAAEFVLRATRPLMLDELMFVRATFGRSIYAVTIEKPQLKAGEVSRIVLIYRGDGQ